MRNKLCLVISFLLLSCGSALAKPMLNVIHWQTANGAKVYFVNAKEIPMVDVLVAFNAGSARDGNLYGLANLTAGLLGEATSKLTTNEIATKIDGLGMEFNSTVNKDMTIVSLRSLSKKKYLEPSLNLFSQLLSDPAFPAKNFNRVKNNTLQAILQKQQSPSAIANNTFMKLVFHNTPYAHDELGNINSVKNITQADVNAFYHRYYVASNAIIVIVGAVNTQEAKHISAEVTQNLPKGQPESKIPSVTTNQSKLVHINFPSDQTTIRIGEVGIPYQKAINHNVIVGNYILGSGLTSRLFKVVRNQYGLTYGIGSYFLSLADTGSFIIALQTKNSQTQEAIAVTKKVLANYLKNGPSAQELQAAKDYLIGSFPLKIESNADIANYVLASAFYQIPFSYLDNYKKAINAVTTKSAKKAMNQFINPNHLIVVTVGQNA